MATPLDEWCKAWLREGIVPVDPTPPDFARAVVKSPTVDQITVAVQMRFEWFERLKTCGLAWKQRELRKNLELVSHWLEAVRLLVPLEPVGCASQRGWDCTDTHRGAQIQSKRAELNRILQQHVLDVIPWVEQSWPQDIGDSFAFYLVNTTEHLHRRLGPKLFFRWHFNGANLRELRAARIVAEDYWRSMISDIHFGNDLAHAIEHFGYMVEDLLGELLGNLPVRWLPFILEAALDGVGAERYAEAMMCHLDVVATAGSRKASFDQLRARDVHSHYDLLAKA